MTLVQGVLTGIGLLILTYLLVHNASGFVSILGKGGDVLVKESTTLQGR